MVRSDPFRHFSSGSPGRPSGIRIPPALPVCWKPLAAVALLQFALHVTTSGNYGIFRDEYYYLACAARPAWGYVDQPSLSIWILAVWKAVFGDSVHSLRILPALCGAGLTLLVGALAARLGGGRWAQIMAAVAAGAGAAGLVLCGFYSMNAFDVLIWSGAYFLLAGIVRRGDGGRWPLLGFLLGIGLLNKIGLLAFGLALVLALGVTPQRRHFLDHRLWIAGVIAALGLAPYLLWNAAHGWPTLEFISNAQRFKISDLSPAAFLTEVALEANPATLPLWLGGICWLLAGPFSRAYRVLGLVFLFTLGIMMLQKSKPYYLAASFPVLIAAGAVAWEGWTVRKGGRWIRGSLAAVLGAGTLLFLPIGLPLLSLEDSLAYQKSLGIVPRTGEDTPGDQAPQYFSDRFGWEELAGTVARVLGELSPAERADCLIIARNYGQAGALEYWTGRYDLPEVYSGHNNYWMWGPPERMPGIVVAVGLAPADLEGAFETVETVAESIEPRARESRITVLVCRGPLVDAGIAWSRLKLFI